MSLCHISVILALFQFFHYYFICHGVCDERLQLAEGRDDGEHFLATERFPMKVMSIIFQTGCCTLDRLQCNVNIIVTCTEKLKLSCGSLYCGTRSPSVVWSGTRNVSGVPAHAWSPAHIY